MTRVEMGPVNYDELGGVVWRDVLLKHCKKCSSIGLVVAKSEESWSCKRRAISYVHNVKIIDREACNWPLKCNSMVVCCYRGEEQHSNKRNDHEK